MLNRMKNRVLITALLCASFAAGQAMADGDDEPNLGDNPDAYTDYAPVDGGGDASAGQKAEKHGRGQSHAGGQKSVPAALSHVTGDDDDDDRCDAADLQKRLQTCR
jgi:hypothetical protein